LAGLTPTTAVSRRLAQPARKVDLATLGEVWFVQSIEARLPMMGVLLGRTDVLPKVRGAWGRALMAGASQDALEGRPCPFDPPCALDVFFREQGRTGSQAIPKPYLFEMDREGPDLIVRLKIFGFASDWAPLAAERLVEALNGHVDWRGLSGMARLKSPKVVDLRTATTEGVVPIAAGPIARVSLLTPFEDAGSNMLDEPWGFVARAARRVSGMARWHDAEIDTSWDELSTAWKSCDFDLSSCRSQHVGRASRGRVFSQSALVGEIAMSGPVEPFWPILLIGSTVGAGRGAVHGLGRFALVP
jgi:hypothetical protein